MIKVSHLCKAFFYIQKSDHPLFLDVRKTFYNLESTYCTGLDPSPNMSRMQHGHTFSYC